MNELLLKLNAERTKYIAFTNAKGIVTYIGKDSI